ncbi:MAG: UPF0053 inner membrane protein YgdQ, partial [uncultured Acetobacteraceae bacterium]
GLPARAGRRPQRLGRPRHADGDGGGARDRQPDLHLDPHQQAARAPAGAGAPSGHRRGAGPAPGPAGDGRHHRAADGPGRLRPILARHDPDRRRPVPRVEGHQGDPPQRGPRPRPRPVRTRAAGGRPELRRGHRPDPAAGPRVLHRQHHHRGGHDGAHPDHGHRRGGHRGRDALRGHAAGELHQREPVGGDAGVGLPAADRHDADRRGLRRARPQGLHLQRHGLLGVGGMPQPAPPAPAGASARRRHGRAGGGRRRTRDGAGV